MPTVVPIDVAALVCLRLNAIVPNHSTDVTLFHVKPDNNGMASVIRSNDTHEIVVHIDRHGQTVWDTYFAGRYQEKPHE